MAQDIDVDILMMNWQVGNTAKEIAKDVFDIIYEVVTNGRREEINGVISLLGIQSVRVLRILISPTCSSDNDEYDRCLLSLALADSTGFLLTYILNRAANEQSLSLDVNRHITFIDDSDDNETVWLTSPLWVAARLHKLDAVEMLLEYGADANVVYNGTTPLFVCLMQFDDSKSTNAVCLRITQMLLERGAETMYCYSKTGVTPLMLAASRCYPQLVEAILEHEKTADQDVSCHVMARDLQGLTAAHYAAGANQHRVFDYTVVNTLKSLCKYGADLYARDNNGRDALMASCQWLWQRNNEDEDDDSDDSDDSDDEDEITPHYVWMRICYLMNALHLPMVAQWRAAELMGAEIALFTRDLLDSGGEEETPPWGVKGHTKIWKKALFIRKQLQPDVIPAMTGGVIPSFFAAYVEPVTLPDFKCLCKNWNMTLMHALQVRRRHLGDTSLPLNKAYNIYGKYLEGKDEKKEKQFNCHMLRLVSRPSVSEFRGMKKKEPHLYTAWLHNLKSFIYRLGLSMFDTNRPLPVPSAEWSCFVQLVHATIDMIILSDSAINQVQLMKALYVSTQAISYVNRCRTDDLQHVVNCLAVGYHESSSDTGTAAVARDDERTQKIFCKMLKAAIHNIHVILGKQPSHPVYLNPDAVRYLVRAARVGGISLDPPPPMPGKPHEDGPLHVCAHHLCHPDTPTGRKTELKRIMEMLVEEGGAHWDATSADGTNIVHIYDHFRVARYTNLQCLAARVVRHVTGYELKLPAALAAFVSIH